jgi:adenosylcobalamin-dependent ribonucleoside-triphosphate reductase
MKPSVRSQIVYSRTYSRPLADGSYETWEQTISRCILHQTWLWQRAQGRALSLAQRQELYELETLMLDRRVALAGRTMWLGGTDIARLRECTQFNCAFLKVLTIHDVVDAYWLLLQGCGIGFTPTPGVLSGFSKHIDLEIIRSDNPIEFKGHEDSREHMDGTTWHIKVGDSAEAWAKFPGKLLAQKNRADKLVVDFRNIRAPGYRLSQYGWISSGDGLLAKATEVIVDVLNNRIDSLLTRIDILDIINVLGSTLSSRRSAEIALVPWDCNEVIDFICAKSYLETKPWRTQSNNTLLFYQRPDKWQLKELFDYIIHNGGSEPGIMNMHAAQRRAPWCYGTNPCGEILLGDKSFCNLVTTNLPSFNGKPMPELARAHRLIARANYRQTCVDLRDGILQRSWHELNQFLRLTGSSCTGIMEWEFRHSACHWQTLRDVAQRAAHSMAQELDLPYSKAVTTIKPEGTMSKVMDTTEGLHQPLGKYIFNNIRFSSHDSMADKLKDAGYNTFKDPYNEDSVIVTVPVCYSSYNENATRETAIQQLEKYLFMMKHYVDHNASITVSYDVEEVPEMVVYIYDNWDHFVGVSFLLRNDSTKSAKDLGYAYLPQVVVTKEKYDEYNNSLDNIHNMSICGDGEAIDECPSGQCPVR